MTTVLITGANRGIGLERARHYAEQNSKVRACCRTPSEAGDLRAVQGDVSVHQLDTTDHGRLSELAGEVSEPIDIVIANAGIYGLPEQDQSFEKVSTENLSRTLEVNLTSTVATLQAFLPHVRRSDEKKLVAITSKMGSISDASQGVVAYRVSKTALNMAMCMAAAELKGEGIAVGTLHPGWVRTDMGGPNGNISAKESARGLAKVIEGLKPSDKAAFKSFSGEEIAW